ncbi:PFL_4703 family integrating conjugative element protein [Pseudomonas gingeri]|uniref:TIGR03746 family integrating conjugative element protein n=1 Tax=Pseudomonas gingeri TaxID=117681 RepID=A0A7Y7YCS1_9PSED|nr:TIGR03746 family integrating conjugative element protein [Pseudomonas gingeri]NWA02324.1 TIGR03746 family integrating conjugative element protein [Pseudomonas gingeri]NWA12503.1 TIGR03746 family integrating conjugative element protein [Pseudomonas gingeri]NWA57091.1 TIGR03746 family integrating conjugative element protein [Pseudomonas gingeri]NWA93434.1 TIGR03746 family integrating conjugative element protein [Pseudomonas gingeri]NWB02906.1 TIGR03746 family integrating conjugative element p
MSRFKNEVARLESHVKSLRGGCALLFGIALLMGLGWWEAPRNLTINIPPDLRSGSTRKWWEVPPESVYTFGFYIFQQLNRWPVDGEKDYPRAIHKLSAYLTPGCKSQLENDFQQRQIAGELRSRTRGVFEIPERDYTRSPELRVKVRGRDQWLLNLDLATEEFYGSERVKQAFVRYPLKVVRRDVDPEKNPFGMALDCYDGAPQRIAASSRSAADAISPTRGDD